MHCASVGSFVFYTFNFREDQLTDNSGFIRKKSTQVLLKMKTIEVEIHRLIVFTKKNDLAEMKYTLLLKAKSFHEEIMVLC